MSSQMAVRSQNWTGRSLVTVKAEYDRAAARTVELDRVYDRQLAVYNKRKRDLKLADRSSRRAQLRGEHEEHSRWINQVEQLEAETLSPLYLQLKRLHEEFERAQALTDALRWEIAEEVRFWRAELAGVDIREVPLVDIKIVDKLPGDFNIYFGGIRVPDGPGHGHFVFQANGSLLFPQEYQPVPRWR